jgi:hypothetical protein
LTEIEFGLLFKFSEKSKPGDAKCKAGFR